MLIDFFSCILFHSVYCIPENIESFIEDQAFSPSFAVAPPQPLPLSHLQAVYLFLSSCVVAGRPTDRRGGEGGGGAAKSHDGEEAWSSINMNKYNKYEYNLKCNIICSLHVLK